MKPQLVALTNGQEFVHWINGSGVDGSGAADDTERLMALRQIRFDGGDQLGHIDFVTRIDRDFPHPIATQTQDFDCLLDATVGFGRTIQG